MNVYYYDVFGRCWNNTWDKANEYQFVGGYGVSVEIGLAGVGLMYMRNRYYDASTGRFLSRDVFFDVLSNIYVYCRNNPVIFLDPLGLFYLKFDGKQVKLYSDNNGLLMSWPAESGELLRTLDYTVEGGPIVPGVYVIYPAEISWVTWRRPKTLFRNLFLDWGIVRVVLRPDEETEKVLKIYKRKNFFLHGGVRPGTLGCVQMRNEDIEQLMKILEFKREPTLFIVEYK